MLDAPTYSALRNNVTATFGDDNGRGQLNYVSPYSKFFNNIEAGRTSLGTTKALEQRVFEIQEQRLECGIPESELRFRTMSYGRFALPPYVSPGEHRVTVKVALSAIPFENEQEKEIFLEIVGSRYNSKKGDLQLSSEKFASRIENKRYLVDMIEKIVLNARKLAKNFDAEDGNAKAAKANWMCGLYYRSVNIELSILWGSYVAIERDDWCKNIYTNIASNA